MDRKQIFVGFFFAIFLLLIYLLYEVIKTFLLPLFWAGVIALVFYPIHERLAKILKNRHTASSLLLTVGVMLLIVLPIVLIISTLALELLDAYQELGGLELSDVKSTIEKIRGFIPGDLWQEMQKRLDVGELEPQKLILKGLGNISSFVLSRVQSGAKNITVLFINFVIMIFALFFFFRDGKRLFVELRDIIPMEDEQKDRIFERFYMTLNAVVIGVMATAAVQGSLAGLIFWILRISFPVFAGVATFIFSLLPIGGATAVWLPVGVYLIITGELLKGIVLLVFGAVVISLVDNFLKPLLIGGRTKLPTLFLFLSIFGGIKAFGFSGLLLGPILLAVFITFVEIYRAEYKEKKA